MARPGSASDCGGSASYSSVFIDTSLGTHLVLMVLDTDTIACLKEKIEKEHPLCFPHIGSVKINAIKVKRRGHFYYLYDSMLVKSAFDGIKKDWFLSVDASSSGETVENQGLIAANSTKLLDCSGINNKTTSNGIVLAPEKRLLNSDHSSLPDDASKHYSKEIVLASEPNGSTSKEALNVSKVGIKSAGENSREFSSHDEMWEKEVPITQITSIEDSSRKANPYGTVNVSQDGVVGASPTVKTKHKRKRNEEDSLNGRALNGIDHSVGENPLQREIVFQENSAENAHTRTVNKVILDEPCCSSSSDAHKKSDYGTQIYNNNLPDETEFTEKVKTNRSSNEVLMQCSSSLEGVSHTEPHASKTRKVETVQGKEEDPLKENRILVSVFNDQTLNNEDVCHQIGEKQSAIETGNIEGGANLLWSLSSTGKKKGRKKTSNRSSKVDSVTPSLGKHVTEDSSVVSAGINDKNTNGEPESAPIPENGLHGTTSDSLQISLKENHNNSVLEPGESRMHENEDTSQQIGGEHGANEKGDLEDVNQLRTCSSSGKKKRKTKSSNRSSKVDSITSSPGKDVKEHSSVANAGINQQIASGEPKLAPIPENDLHGITTSKPLQTSLKEKQNDAVLELGETNAPSLKEKEVFASDSNKESSQTEVSSQIIGEKQRAEAALDSSPLSSGKKKKKKKSSTAPNQLDAVNSAPGKDVKDGNSTVTARINQKDSDVEPDAPPVLPQITETEKQTSSVLEMGESKIPSLEENKVLIADSNKETPESKLTSPNLRKKRKTKSSRPPKNC